MDAERVEAARALGQTEDVRRDREPPKAGFKLHLLEDLAEAAGLRRSGAHPLQRLEMVARARLDRRVSGEISWGLRLVASTAGPGGPGVR